MAFDPKRFYRHLDVLLGEIDSGTANIEWLEWLTGEILNRFGDQLSINSGRLYQSTTAGYRLIRQYRSIDPEVQGLVLPFGYQPLAQVEREGVVIFDQKNAGQDVSIEGRLGGLESVGIFIEEADPPLIIAFGLAPGWERDRLGLALHTIRNALNHRVSIIGLGLVANQAAELQRSLVASAPPAYPGFSIAGRSIPADMVGGDFYDFLLMHEETMGLVIGDASGHGLPAALVARDAVTGLRMAAERDLKITATIRRLNKVIARSLLSTRFVSLFYCEIEKNGSVFYVNAGHQPGFLFQRGEVQRLEIGGSILGPLEDATFKRGFAHLDRGGTLVLLTDGVLERRAPDGSFFGDEGVERVMASNLGASAQVCLEALFSAAELHGEGRPWEDDTTIVVVVREH